MIPFVPSGIRRGSAPFAALAVLGGLLVTGCAAAGSPSPVGSSPNSSQGRPSSPAAIKIIEPASGTTVTGSSVHVVLTLEGARIVSATTTSIRPDEGHIHLFVNNQLVSMNYGLEQDIAISAGTVVPGPGTYVLKAEFVAADHAPFNPRVWSPEVYFTVP